MTKLEDLLWEKQPSAEETETNKENLATSLTMANACMIICCGWMPDIGGKGNR